MFVYAHHDTLITEVHVNTAFAFWRFEAAFYHFITDDESSDGTNRHVFHVSTMLLGQKYTECLCTPAYCVSSSQTGTASAL